MALYCTTGLQDLVYGIDHPGVLCPFEEFPSLVESVVLKVLQLTFDYAAQKKIEAFFVRGYAHLADHTTELHKLFSAEGPLSDSKGPFPKSSWEAKGSCLIATFESSTGLLASLRPESR